MISSLEIVQYMGPRPGANGSSPAFAVGRFQGPLSSRDAELLAGLLMIFATEGCHVVVERRCTDNAESLARYLRVRGLSYHVQENHARRLKVSGLLPRFEDVAEPRRMWIALDRANARGFLEQFWPGEDEAGHSFLVVPEWVTPAIWALQNSMGRDGLRQSGGVLYKLDQSRAEYLDISGEESRIRMLSRVEHFAVSRGLPVAYVKK